MTQSPRPGEHLLFWRGDVLAVSLETAPGARARRAKAFFRTDIGGGGWRDVPMRRVRDGRWEVEIALDAAGVFSGKACLFEDGAAEPLWPDGGDVRVKVCPARAKSRNSIYTVFPRQFGSFREVVRKLPHIMDEMGFSIVQTLPPFPVPENYARMGEYGCPFAATDFFSVDPAMAEFDRRSTPLDQFRELVDAVHAKGGLFFIDIAANHTGWASTLQTHHPEWFRRCGDGEFASPGAWGVTWEDLVELDYSNRGLERYMAGVFLFWCRFGIDGFRCDAGYKIPCETWKRIAGAVRAQYPDTVFMLEGLGGDPRATDALLADAGLDWAYSELFQTYDRDAFEAYLPAAMARSAALGTLVHFAETHDNDRLAKSGRVYARMRVMLAALLSAQGAWGIANGVEWFCDEKIDVHGRNGLAWGAKDNMVRLIGSLNRLLATHPSFAGQCRIDTVERGGGNVLAVLRTSPDGGRALVLANLDCDAPGAVDWDAAAFPGKQVADLLSGEAVELRRPFPLAPGEVRIFGDEVRRTAAAEPVSGEAARVFEIGLPVDAKRDVAVPAGEETAVVSPCAFRLDVVDAAGGRTLRALRDPRRRGDGMFEAVFAAPEYEGDGTRCRELRLDAVLFENGRSRRVSSRLFIPPPPCEAAARLSFDGEETRRSPQMRAILSNGAGAAAQIRAGWGRIESQYDAILAFNPNPSCPSDRVNVLARLRCWARWRGYSCKLDETCATEFAASPGGDRARWRFDARFGDGASAAIAIDVSLVPGSNAAEIVFTRLDGGDDGVSLVARPDVEWRSFHDTTKASGGAEKVFPGAVSTTAGARGFEFAPYGGVLAMSVAGGAGDGRFNADSQWEYCVAHAEEAARGQEPCGDLFSPGWFSASLPPKGRVVFHAAVRPDADCAVADPPAGKAVAAIPDMPSRLPVRESLEKALDLFVARRGGLKTVVAGYPWFLDWGRDTFIFMRGMIAAGRIDDSLAILRAFAAFEDRGTLPNIIYGETAGNRDTSDAPLWFVRCTMEAEAAGGDVSGLKDVCRDIVAGYTAGTPNGIRVDGRTSLVWSPSHFTWMDTNYPACTPREGYPVEIQALWISALEYLGRAKQAAEARRAFSGLFARDGGGLCDCLAAGAGTGAMDAAKDASLRPNQLLAVSLGVLDDKSIPLSCSPLAVPGSIRSLDARDGRYRGVYAGDENASRKPAYHNGTAWGWLFPSYAESLAVAGVLSRGKALELLASSVENMNGGGVPGQMSEIADGDAPHSQKGCAAQAWSASETLRVWLALAGRR